MAQQIANGKQQFIDGNGAPLAGGSVAFYSPGTLNPVNTWQDSGLTVLNANPVTLDANGMASIWGVGSTQYRQIVKDVLGNTVWDQVVGLIDSYQLSATGAVVRPVPAKLAESVSVLDFGADPTGVADSTAAIQAALTALVNGGKLRVPAGFYKASGLTWAGAVGASLLIEGDGEASILQINNTTGTLFTSNGGDVVVSNMHVEAASVGLQTAGVFFQFNGGRCELRDVTFSNGYQLAKWNGTTTAVCYGGGAHNIKFSGTTGTAFYVDCSPSNSQIGGQLFFSKLQGQGVPSTTGYGLQLVSGDTVMVSDSVIAGFVSNIFSHSSATRGYLANVHFINVDGDGAGGTTTLGNGWDFDGSAGFLARVDLQRCWAGTMLGNGMSFKNLASLQIQNCTAINNDQDGILVDTCQDVEIFGGIVTGNSAATHGSANGIVVQGTSAGINIQGVRVGPTQNGTSAGAVDSQNYGIIIASTGVTKYIVMGCDLRGNVTSFQDGGTGTNGSTKMIYNNITGTYP